MPSKAATNRFATAPSQMTDDAFMTSFGSIYEHADWVASTILADGVSGADDEISHLAMRMAAIVDAAGHEAQLALLRAHPELAGKLALAGELTAESTNEQAGAGLDQCSPEEFDAFQRLNTAYGDKFGHPFIIAVRGLNRSDILAAFERRIDNDAATEFATALAEVHKIARLRLEAMAG
ncbi:MAG: 2-oxo-4-hydroxy-4-carboxy-5-ureidoimidazoline decarboxylase [Alphaproteobacteria bacterium]